VVKKTKGKRVRSGAARGRVQRMGGTRARTAYLFIRLSEEEEAVLEAEATLDDMKLATWAREQLMRMVRMRQDGRIMKIPGS
jgi:hypothetical protein